MGKLRVAALGVLACALAFAATAAARQVGEICTEPAGGNGATSCTVIIDQSVSGTTESDAVVFCLGEDVFVTLDAHIVAHELFRPGDEVPSTHLAATIHGTGYGVLSGAPVRLNENASGTVDYLPNGDQLYHVVTPGEVITPGSAPNLEFTIELQVLTAADGTQKNVTLNAQAKCGSEHDHEHDKA
jgi:hypothetical protein